MESNDVQRITYLGEHIKKHLIKETSFIGACAMMSLLVQICLNEGLSKENLIDDVSKFWDDYIKQIDKLPKEK